MPGSFGPIVTRRGIISVSAERAENGNSCSWKQNTRAPPYNGRALARPSGQVASCWFGYQVVGGSRCELSGHLFLFSKPQRHRLESLFGDGSGLWACAKRLDNERFAGPYFRVKKQKSCSAQKTSGLRLRKPGPEFAEPFALATNDGCS